LRNIIYPLLTYQASFAKTQPGHILKFSLPRLIKKQDPKTESSRKEEVLNWNLRCA